MARPRKLGVKRDEKGKWRGYAIHPETIAVRERQLAHDGIILKFEAFESGRRVEKRTADDRLSGFTLGRLYLRHRQDKTDPSGISEEQMNAGEAWASLVRRHAAIMGYSVSLKTPSLLMISGSSAPSADPDEETILYVRRRWSDCYNLLMEVCRDHGLTVRDVVYGVCVENWPISALGEKDFGNLRMGLNAIGRALK